LNGPPSSIVITNENAANPPRSSEGTAFQKSRSLAPKAGARDDKQKTSASASLAVKNDKTEGAPSLPSFGRGGTKDLDNRQVFWAFAAAGKTLADLHVNYEQQPECPLQRIENPNEKLNLRVEKMKLSKDKSTLTYNSFLTLGGIPPETYEYRLGNRSTLEWIVDQYQVSTDKRSGITNDPNREDDPEYIVRLIGQVIHVSLETVKIVRELAKYPIVSESAATSSE